MVNAQEWLDRNYPKNGTCTRKESDKKNYKKTRKQITRLDIYNENLNGSLNLDGFVNLEIIYCSDNQLTSLDFLSDLNPKKLTELDIRNNKFPKSDLTFLSGFINLERLFLSNFIGSLEPLAELTKLKILDIGDSSINSGLEYLSESVESFFCSVNTKLHNEYFFYRYNHKN